MVAGVNRYKAGSAVIADVCSRTRGSAVDAQIEETAVVIRLEVLDDTQGRRDIVIRNRTRLILAIRDGARTVSGEARGITRRSRFRDVVRTRIESHVSACFASGKVIRRIVRAAGVEREVSGGGCAAVVIDHVLDDL